MVLRLSQEDLENLKYAELRKLAKEAGIKANMKVNTLSRNSIAIDLDLNLARFWELILR